MVYRKKRCATRCRRRPMKGRGINSQKVLNWLKKVNTKLRSSKFLSRAGKSYGQSGLPGAIYAGKVGEVASKFGYGRRRRRGGALRLAGGGLGLSGSGRFGAAKLMRY